MITTVSVSLHTVLQTESTDSIKIFLCEDLETADRIDRISVGADVLVELIEKMLPEKAEGAVNPPTSKWYLEVVVEKDVVCTYKSVQISTEEVGRYLAEGVLQALRNTANPYQAL